MSVSERNVTCNRIFFNNLHYVKSVQIQSFFWSEYRKIQTRKKCLFGHFSHSVRAQKYELKWRSFYKTSFTKHLFILTSLLQSYLIKYSGMQSSFKDIQNALKHSRHSENAWTLEHSENT